MYVNVFAMHPPDDRFPAPPLGALGSLIAFGVPAIALVVAFHAGIPWLVQRGWPDLYAVALALGVPLAGLGISAIIATRMEGLPWQWDAWVRRLRLRRLDARAWGWTLLTSLVALPAYQGLQRVAALAIEAGWWPLPEALPATFDPRVTIELAGLADALGVARIDAAVVAVYAALLVANVVGEELWWRGYLLPRQEAAFGARTWWAHGLAWTAFHAFKWWDLLPLLPLTLGLSLLAVRLRSTTAGLAMHAIANGLLLPVLIVAALQAG